ncbi:TlpA family protein disulfide reductase [Paracidovorax valerianellae]|uniref:Thiol-disulfide isomerase or thioredoxin n=1 Tax=Paracidovorax valerianellae TaxID=187868 RepID=A0A1G6Q298_9BURK|nr:TlpA disulfide reductase family protein [Paracidovorax valerianellae]MDA8444501.1 TlpA family protein disulfide reductase [Paracidovorax valerianellae]SDC86044.1 Thiol-disulfide isomerase or thioredoxin [Paracidovorax valerianellae]
MSLSPPSDPGTSFSADAGSPKGGGAAQGAASSSRRRWLYGGVAAAAALGGAGLAWWRFQPHAVMTGAEAALWAERFDAPAGGEPVAMERFRGKPLLVNFWATWCPPCVDELPLLNAFYRENAAKGWQVVGLAIDQPSSVRKFLDRLPLEFPVGLAGLSGTELGRSLGNLTGGLPFSVLLGADGTVLHRKMGQVTPQDLQQWVALG